VPEPGDRGTPGAAPGRVRAFGPGRVNLIGEHTDYNDGLCLPFAIARGVTVAIEPGDERTVEARAVDLGERDAFPVGAPAPAAGWRAFVRGTVAELADAGHRVRGGRVSISGTLARGRGLSSSAALAVALALALLEHGGDPEPDRRDLARLCSRVENRWVGARTGLLDQLAALFGHEAHAIRIDLRDLAIGLVPLDLGAWRLVVADSGVARTHAASGYNERRRECRAACELLGVPALRDAGAGALARLPAPLDRRARHVVTENRRVGAAVRALELGDRPALGRLLDASHASLRDDFEVSVPEVEATRARLKAAGAAGARIMGGGFGGSVLALLPPGVDPPRGAEVVAPGPSAHLVQPADPARRERAVRAGWEHPRGAG
jgi:galactokinase